VCIVCAFYLRELLLLSDLPELLLLFCDEELLLLPWLLLLWLDDLAAGADLLTRLLRPDDLTEGDDDRDEVDLCTVLCRVVCVLCTVACRVGSDLRTVDFCDADDCDLCTDVCPDDSTLLVVDCRVVSDFGAVPCRVEADEAGLCDVAAGALRLTVPVCPALLLLCVGADDRRAASLLR
jgi:hypothetical protein